MTSTAGSSPRLMRFTLLIYWGCILLGIGIPWLATIASDVIVHDQSVMEALHQLRLHLFAPGYNLFLIAVLNAVPFTLFAIFSLFHLGLVSLQDRKLISRRGSGVVVTALGLIGVSTWTHLTTLWHPDAQGAIAYLFIPFVLFWLMPAGYALGRGLGMLIFR